MFIFSKCIGKTIIDGLLIPLDLAILINFVVGCYKILRIIF